MRLPTLLTLLLAAAIPAQSEDLYDLTKVRSLYIQFSSANWYSQLVANRTTGAHLQGDVIVDSKLFQQIGVRMVGAKMEVTAPFGLTDLCAMVVRLNKAQVRADIYEAKVARWREQWPAIDIGSWNG